ncbi:hypothetical protein BH20ACT13_BH20ACT13_15440 [soil metagenome]
MPQTVGLDPDRYVALLTRSTTKEAREDGVLYALVAGQWYEVRASFADEVIEFAERLPELDLPT